MGQRLESALRRRLFQQIPCVGLVPVVLSKTVALPGLLESRWLTSTQLTCQLDILVESQRIFDEVSMMVARQVRRVSKMEAVNILEVSLSTVERMIKRGELQVEKEDVGSRHRVWILLDEGDIDLSDHTAQGKSAEYSPEVQGEGLIMSEREELVALRVQVKGLQDLSHFRAEQLKESAFREQMLLQQMEKLTRALPAPVPAERKLRGWWPWRRRS